jgi:hypothetical protein
MIAETRDMSFEFVPSHCPGTVDHEIREIRPAVIGPAEVNSAR